MKQTRSLIVALLATLAVVGLGAPAVADHRSGAQPEGRSDQSKARKEMKAGNHLSLREIERRVLPRMKGSEYLGPAYDATAHAYRLKFIKDGRVMYVDVDARTGKIINRSR